jgi:hypothetical protein
MRYPKHNRRDFIKRSALGAMGLGIDINQLRRSKMPRYSIVFSKLNMRAATARAIAKKHAPIWSPSEP